VRGADPRKRGDLARELAAQLHAQADEVKCVRCGASTFMLTGTRTGYKCEVCHFTFEGPPHMPDTAG